MKNRVLYPSDISIQCHLFQEFSDKFDFQINKKLGHDKWKLTDDHIITQIQGWLTTNIRKNSKKSITLAVFDQAGIFLDRITIKGFEEVKK